MMYQHDRLREVEDLDHVDGGAWLYRGTLWVYQTFDGASIQVSPDGPPQDVVGGMALLESFSDEALVAWLEAKYELYL